MSKPSRKKQIKHSQTEAERRKKRAALRHQTQMMNVAPDVAAQVRAASGWPLYEVLLSAGWQTPGALVQALVARRSPGGRIAAAGFLIDLGCLGVKSAFANLYASESEYQYELRAGMMSHGELIPADLNLVAKILREGIAYARQLGFNPDPDYRNAVLLLGTANPDASEEAVPLGGEDGKPLFVSGPHDDARAIVDQLTRKCGEGGFNYIVTLGGPDAFLTEDWDDEPEDWDEEEEAFEVIEVVEEVKRLEEK